jgi:hypothetical protein
MGMGWVCMLDRVCEAGGAPITCGGAWVLCERRGDERLVEFAEQIRRILSIDSESYVMPQMQIQSTWII